jgi:hypothetical protein
MGSNGKKSIISCSKSSVMKKNVVILSVVLLTSCSAKLLRPTLADVDRGSAKFPGLTVAQLNEGKALFERKCTQCHPAKKPSSRDEVKWRQVVPAMAAKATKRGKEEISEADQDKILKYLITMSRSSKS